MRHLPSAFVVLMLSLAVVEAQESARDAKLIWTCPVHREVTEREAGQCPLCQRELVRSRIQEAWSCPLHTLVAEPGPGKCPVCKRTLYPISQEVVYACPMHPDVRQAEAGSCPICRMALVAGTATRPHQDHNPKRGGIFFMARDAWHHLEGVYPEPGVFRVHLYDNFSQPMSAKGFKGRAVLKESYDASTRETKELLAYPLLPSEDGEYLEAHVGNDDLPREITAKIQFEREGPFERFDFVFADLSRVDEVAPESTSVAGELGIPETAREIVSAIGERRELVSELVREGAFNQIYVSALEAKDLALALEPHSSEVPEASKPSLRWALKELVRAAWLLDDYGDLGNREKVHWAYERFEEAVHAIEKAYGVER